MYGTYEEPATRFLERHASPAWTFLDVGACEGYYAVLAVALGGTASRVVAVEPNPRMVEQLRETVRIGRHRIEVLPNGCGSSRAILPLTISDVAGNIGMSSFAKNNRNRGAATVDVPIVTLDGVCADRELRPDVVKIDVEGFEGEVLEGFVATLNDSPPRLLLVELVPDSRSHAFVLELLSRHGYRARRILEDGSDVPLHSVHELHQVQLAAFTRR
jgi:FkbM family methyltransferase